MLLAATVATGVLGGARPTCRPRSGSRIDTGVGEGAVLVWKIAFTALLFASLGSRGGCGRALARVRARVVRRGGLLREANAFVWRKWGRLTLDAGRFAARSPVTSLLLGAQRPEEGRVYTRVDLFVEEFTTRPRLEGPNLTALHGLHNVAGVEPLIPERYSLALGGVGPDSVNVRAGFPDNRALLSARSRTLDLLNTTHLVSFAGLRKSPDPPAPRDGVSFAPGDLGVTLAPGERVELSAGNSAGDTLALVTSLANSGPEEEEELKSRASFCTRRTMELAEPALRAGRGPSEWAHERATFALPSNTSSRPSTQRAGRRGERLPVAPLPRAPFRVGASAPGSRGAVEARPTRRVRASARALEGELDRLGRRQRLFPLHPRRAETGRSFYERDDALVLRTAAPCRARGFVTLRPSGGRRRFFKR